MASVKKGILAKSPQWWKHLRSFKRTFWRRNRQAERREITAETNDGVKKRDTVDRLGDLG